MAISNGLEFDVIASFLEIVRTQPDYPAVVENGSVVTYRRLSELAASVASSIKPRTNLHDAPIAIIENFSAYSIAGVLGILAAGRCFCAVDPSIPPDGQTAMLDAAGVEELVATLPADPIPDVQRVLRPVWSDAELTVDQVVAPPQSSPAYILFTSGTTGVRKGAVLPRSALSTVVPELVRLYDIRPTDKVLHFTPLFWDTSLEEILPTLTQGATLVIDNYATTDLLGVLASQKVTVLNLPTSYWGEFVSDLLDSRSEIPSSLRTAVIGGEALRMDMLDKWRRLDAKHVRLVNTYGATETGMVTHAIDLTEFEVGVDGTSSSALPLGRPLPHVSQKLVDKAGREVTAAGAEGELYLSGENIALEYRGQPELTARRLPELDLGDGTRRYFRTGDIMQTDQSGCLYFRGRVDHVIKVRGIRVDITEIEAWVASHPDVRAVAVVEAMKGDHNTLIGYVVAEPNVDEQLFIGSILRYLGANVPRYLIPGRLQSVPALKYTTTRKVDRIATRRYYENEHRVH
ncbi:hypothetical protein CH249_01370 [Rhodococcus sp. 05-2255-3B1]|uniref:AMP-binding protein n=1 Tax=unclassified Rhodococcus (in: high G+C Gram-positive bacteria) TaxID=192944 RepID=UPI000B9C1099|nr:MULTISPECIES: AMP-binding protein [unclassified Rhodococcus (in: high G+C Gram-positive bacteria)]OZE13452.1 hypothetical protein CH250_05995 [Rhodococcus sp. 05-2255-3C]OZE15933.1 hypothetical protein CH249_01370 [Rhodococcus sp. 05-2255-3B1]OZE18972.1 hypothetical protein CH255_13395 [Rhodococcus sp. 05-2255-2A2]